jgi:hypothetical protein
MRGEMRQSLLTPRRHREHAGAHRAQHTGPFRLDLLRPALAAGTGKRPRDIAASVIQRGLLR